jgi:hypothetical protein
MVRIHSPFRSISLFDRVIQTFGDSTYGHHALNSPLTVDPRIPPSMSFFQRCLPAALLLAACALAAPAKADEAKAAACAKTLKPEAMTIYQDVAPKTGPNTDLRSLLTSHTRLLVIAGRVQRGTARSSAYAAYSCLKDLQ